MKTSLTHASKAKEIALGTDSVGEILAEIDQLILITAEKGLCATGYSVKNIAPVRVALIQQHLASAGYQVKLDEHSDHQGSWKNLQIKW